MIALKSQRIAILDILGHIQGTKRKKIWHSVYEQSVGILKIVNAWVKSVLRLKWKSPKMNRDIMEATAYGPSYLKSLDSLTTSNCCIECLENLSKKLHGKKRQQLRENIN